MSALACEQVGTTLRPEVNYGKRFGHARHHTATHLLGLALKEVLLRGGASCKKAPEGEEKTSVQQKGSLVEEQRLRFDFDWDRPLTSEELEGLELHVQRAVSFSNENRSSLRRVVSSLFILRGRKGRSRLWILPQIVSALPVTTTVMPLKDAMELPSLCALFGEVYPDPVRVVTVGPDVKELREVKARKGEAAVVHSSVELCGGTHVSNAAQLQVRLKEEKERKGLDAFERGHTRSLCEGRPLCVLWTSGLFNYFRGKHREGRETHRGRDGGGRSHGAFKHEKPFGEDDENSLHKLSESEGRLASGLSCLRQTRRPEFYWTCPD